MRARLIGHCEWVTISPIARDAMLIDDLADEPYSGIARGPSVELLAQVSEISRNTRRPSQSGAKIPARLSLTFLTRDVRASGWNPKDGDLIVSIQGKRRTYDPRPLSLYVQAARFSGKDSCGGQLVLMDAVSRDGRQPNEGLF